MRALELIRRSSYDPATIEMLGSLLNEIWEEVATRYPNEEAAVSEVRERLATTLLRLSISNKDRATLKALVMQLLD